MKKLWVRSFLCTGILISGYFAAYCFIAERDSGHARGAGAYFHYRIFAHDWEGVIFRPLCELEARIIRAYPRPFIASSSWADLPQYLIIQTPDRNLSIPKQS